MHGNVTDADFCSTKSDAVPCTRHAKSDGNCNIMQDPQWFGVLCRALWPTKPWLMLMQLAGIKERSAHNYASGQYAPNAEVLRDLLRGPEGYLVLVWLMHVDPPTWWADLQRERKDAAKLKKVEEIVIHQ